MGVPGLWRLLEPARCPIELDQLTGKIVAIDMNIWLHQAVKSRASSGGPRSFLAILFRRLCKLIYFGIRPVFVFDGEVPTLKKSTMATRRRLRGQLGDKAERARSHMLRRLLKRIAESDMTKRSSDSSKHQSKAKAELIRRLAQDPDIQQAKEDVQLFSAPPDQLEPSQELTSGLLHEKAGLEYDDLARDYLNEFNLYISNDSNLLDLQSTSFRSLPIRAQLRVVEMARKQLDSQYPSHGKSLSQSDSLDQLNDTETFSTNQVGRLLLRRRLAERHKELSREIIRQDVATQLTRLNNHQLHATIHEHIESYQSNDCSANVLRIQSQDVGHAILIKKSPIKLLPGQKRSDAVLPLESLILPTDAEPHEYSQNHDTSDETIRSVFEDTLEQPVVSSDTGSDLDTSEPHEAFESVEHKSSSSKLDVLPSLSNDVQMMKGDSGEQSTSPSLATCAILEPSEHDTPSIDLRTTKDQVADQSIPIHDNPVTTVGAPHPQRHSDPPGQEQASVSLLSESDDEFEEVPLIVDQVPIDEISTSDTTDSAGEVSADDSKLPDLSTFKWSNEVASRDYDDDATFELDDDVLREQADRLSRQAQTTTTRCIDEAQQLLNLFGVPYLTSPEEAEAQCVSLQLTGSADVVASDDSDVWPFGATAVCRHLFGGAGETDKRPSRMRSNSRLPSLYTSESVRKTVGLSTAHIVRLAVLCGGDYTPGIQNVGPVTGVEILSEFTNSDEAAIGVDGRQTGVSDNVIDEIIAPLERFSRWWQSSQLSSTSDSQSNIASPVRRRWLKLNPPLGFPDPRIVSAYLHPNINRCPGAFVWTPPDVPSLIKHAKTAFDWSTDRTEAMLSAIIKRSQLRSLGSPSTGLLRITDYFQQKSHHAGEQVQSITHEPDEVSLPSKRARKAVLQLSRATSLSKTNADMDIHPRQDPPVLNMQHVQQKEKIGPRASTGKISVDDPNLSQLPRRGRGSKKVRGNRMSKPTYLHRHVVEQVNLSDKEDE